MDGFRRCVAKEHWDERRQPLLSSLFSLVSSVGELFRRQVDGSKRARHREIVSRLRRRLIRSAFNYFHGTYAIFLSGIMLIYGAIRTTAAAAADADFALNSKFLRTLGIKYRVVLSLLICQRFRLQKLLRINSVKYSECKKNTKRKDFFL